MRRQLIALKKNYWNPIALRNKTKYFCIGHNKTGTTSIHRAFIDLGFEAGSQRSAEELYASCYRRDYAPLIRYCKSAEVFQDFPFSCTDVYRILDNEFPNSKFILTVRNDEKQWYKSLVKYHSKKFGNGNIPTSQQLKEADYVKKAWVWEFMAQVYGVNENDPYNEQKLTEYYLKRNEEILKYFSRRSNFMVLNIAHAEAYARFCDFVGRNTIYENFPWENKT